jgi:hypothetical protein
MTKSLEAQVSAARLLIATENISMSIGEFTSLYKEGVLNIRPEFQRLFRWDLDQKSRLVESVLLGIPLPSLFISQSQGGGWELVDGLQRTSTLLELQGLLKDPDGSTREPFELSATPYLPELEGCRWENPSGPELNDALKLDIRFARLDLKIIKRDSSAQAKFDLFQRLNSFGSSLTAQEIRSAMIAGTNDSCIVWLTELANYENYRESIGLNEQLRDQQYDLELILRFFMLHQYDVTESLGDFTVRLDAFAVSLADSMPLWAQLERTFKDTFDWIDAHGGDRLFKKWDATRGIFRNGFSNTAFEVFALGLGYHLAKGDPVRADLVHAAQSLWSLPEMNTRFATGLNTQRRLMRTVPIGRKLVRQPPLVVSAADFSG